MRGFGGLCFHDDGHDDRDDDRRKKLPGYLLDAPKNGHIYGTLSYNRRSKCWTIKGEPCVTEMAARLFPGSQRRRGEARFTANRRIIGDVNWLMLRYPLEIAPRDPRALGERADAGAGTRDSACAGQAAPEERAAGGDVRRASCGNFRRKGFPSCWHPRTLLADEMGLGKTVQALACLAATGAFPALIVVPPHLLRNWQAEAARFLRIKGRPPRVYVLTGLKPYQPPEADVYIIHYLLLRGLEAGAAANQFARL